MVHFQRFYIQFFISNISQVLAQGDLGFQEDLGCNSHERV